MKQETLEKFAVEVGNNFKQTEKTSPALGDWKVVKLEEILFPDRIKLKHTQYDGSIPIVEKIQFDTGKIVFRKKKQTRTDLYLGEKGRLLTSKINFHQGAVAIITNEGKIAATTHYEIYRVNEKKSDIKFLWYYLRSPFFREIFYHEIKFAGFKKEANYKFIKNFKIPLPPLPEQCKIAKVLDKIQQASELQDRIIEQAKRLKKSLMQKLFTEGLYGEEQKKTKIGLIPKSWEVVRLGDDEILKETQYGLSVRGKKEGKYPILRMNNLVEGLISIDDLQFVDLDEKTFRKFKLEKGDILFNRTNSFELVGKTSIFHLDGNFVFASYLIRLKLNSEIIDPFFFNFYFNWDVTQLRLKGLASRGVSQANISATKLKSFLIPLPPLEEQKQIAHILSIVDRKIEVEQKRKQVLKELFKTMIHTLMSGEIRLKEMEI